VRKTLMLSEANYRIVSGLAAKSRAPRHLVLDALLATADEDRVLAKLQELRIESRSDKVEERKKRQMLGQMVKDLPAGELEVLLTRLRDSGGIGKSSLPDDAVP